MRRPRESKRADAGLTPAHNREAERATLGAIIVNNDKIDTVRQIVDVGHFFDERNRVTLRAALMLRDRGEPIDLVTLQEQLAHTGGLETAGGAVYLGALVDGVPKSQNAEHYARIVRRVAADRAIAYQADAVLQRLAENPADSDAAIDELRRVIDARTARDATGGLDVEALADAVTVAAEGVQIARDGVPYIVGDLIPAYGMLGMLVAYAKVGKTSLGMALGAAVATGAPFLDRPTEARRVLDIAAEDPPEYTAFLARHLAGMPDGRMTFYRRPIVLDAAGLGAIAATVQAGGYGLVLMSSWQAVTRGLLKDENDNAGAVRVVEAVKACARSTGIPWLIDAHSGKGEDQADEAAPGRATKGPRHRRRSNGMSCP